MSLVALGVFAAAANADPLSMTFTEARANVGKQLSDSALFSAPETAPFSAQLDPATGTISNGTLGVLDFETTIEEPIHADVTISFDIGQITGSFDQATGALSLTGTAGGTLTASGNPTYDGEQCTVLAEPSPITLTTAGSSGGTNPRSGVPFTAGLSGSGAIAGEWQNMSAEPVEPGVVKNENFCEDVENQIGGAGGIWMEQKDVVPPAAPQLISTDPASPSLSGTPRILGSAEPGSTVRIYAGSGCTGASVGNGTAAELGSPGIGISVAADTTATFSATATDAAGNTSSCSATISYTRIHADLPPPPPATCVVPNLTGKKLGRAKAELRKAHCSVGKVFKPKHMKGRRRGALVVKSSTPAAGTILAAGSPVNLKLGHQHHKQRRH
ncbi:MAG TPA: PASTA domain-containing protein [Solirubrobacterales bacterium]